MLRIHVSAALMVTALLATPASAQTYSWQGGAANNNWSLADNWSNGFAPSVNGSVDLRFLDQYFPNGVAYIYPNLDANYFVNSISISGNSSFSMTANSGCVLTLGGGGLNQNTVNDQTMNFPVALSAAQTWTFSGGSNLTVAGGINAKAQPLTISSAGPTTLNGAITGTSSLTKEGTGTLTLVGAGSNLYSLAVQAGTVTLNGGSLTLTSPESVHQQRPAIFVGTGSASASLIVQGGALLDTSTAAFAAVGSPSASQSVTIQGVGTLWKLPAETDIGDGGNGTITVQSGGKLTGGSAFNLGDSGTGTAQILAGSQMNTSAVNVGFVGSGALTVSGAGAALTASAVILANEGGLDTGTLTVSNGGTFTVTSAAINSLTSSVTVTGGTLSIGNLSAISGYANPITITDPAVGPALTLGTGNTSSTFGGPITDGADGPGTVNKVGAGTLTLTGHLTNTGGYTATAGTIEFSGALVQPGSGTLAAAAGATIQYDAGARVFGGFLAGPGTHIVNGATFTGVTSFNSAAISVTGAASFVNFSNGGPLNVAAGLSSPLVLTRFTNQGSGSITIGAVSTVNANDFQSYGTLTLNPATIGSGQFTDVVNTGSSPLSFNGGSRTFIGTAATAINPATGQPANLAGINLNGQNAVVAGGLFVNNGFVVDGSAAGTATIVADFGSLVKGAGYFQNPVITQNGGKFQAGNSPGSASFGSFVLGPGGVDNYVFAIDDATGTAGPSPNAAGQVSGWGLVKATRQQFGSITTSGNFTWTADPADKLTVALDTLVNPTVVGTDVAGPMADFDPTLSYSWPAVTWTGAYSGPTDALALDAATSFDTTGFENPINGTFGWSLDAADQTLSLTYTPTPVPEPGTLALTGIAAIGWVTFWRRRWK
jgi:fibronectin-binding autotransporter adhesin